jgi:large subunit ribosomal protein L6
MSRLANRPIEIPNDVNVVFDKNIVTVSGKKVKKDIEVPSEVSVNLQKDSIEFKCDKKHSKKIQQMFGTVFALTKSAILSANKGFQKELSLVGVGYKASMQGKLLCLSLAYSHNTYITIPEGINVSVTETTISLESGDNVLLGRFCQFIRDNRKIEPYKGKGIRFKDENVILKEIKKK